MATPPLISEEIPESQAKINEELFRFQAELKSEMAWAKMKLDFLISMLMENRKSKAEDQPPTTTSDGILFTPPSSAEAENEALSEQDECEVELPMVSMDLHLDSTFGDVQPIKEQQNGAQMVFDKMSESILDELDIYDLGVGANTDQLDTNKDQMNVKYSRAALLEEHVIDFSAQDVDLIKLYLFDPGGDRKCAMSSSRRDVPELFGKVNRTCDNGVKAFDGSKNVTESEACSEVSIGFVELTEAYPTALFNDQVNEQHAHYLFDVMSHPESEFSDELTAAEDVDDVQSNELEGQIEAESGNIVSPIVTCSVLDELPKPKSTIIYHLIEDDSKLTHPVFPIFVNMVEHSGACKVFAEMTEPILEKDLLGIKVTEAAHNLLDESPMLSPVDLELILGGHFEEHNGNNDSTPLLVCVPRVFDPGRVTTVNVCPNGSSIVEIECTFTPPYIPSLISLKHIGATVLSNMPSPSLQLISFISWSGNESIDESCMNHLLDQKEDIAGYSLGLVLHGCEVGQPNLLTVRSIKADYQLFDNVTERFLVEQRNGSANNGNSLLPASFPAYSGFKYDALKAVLGMSSSKMMFGGMRFGEMAVFMFDPGINSWHIKDCDSINSCGIPGNSFADLWVGKVLLCFEPGGNTFVLGTWSLRNTLSKSWDRLFDDTGVVANYLSSYDTSALKAINGFLMKKTYTGSFDRFDVFLEMLVDYWNFALLIPIYLTYNGQHLCGLVMPLSLFIYRIHWQVISTKDPDTSQVMSKVMALYMFCLKQGYLHEIICSAFSIVIERIRGMDYDVCENEFPCCWNLGSSYDVLIMILVVLSQSAILLYILEDKDCFEGVEKKILAVLMIRSIKDNHCMSRTKGMAIQLALVLKQGDEKLSRASIYYFAHTGFLAYSLVDWEILLLLITSSKFRYNLKELLVTFRSVGLDCEIIIDAMRFKWFDDDSELNIVVHNLINKDINPSPQFGLAFSTLGLEQFIWDPGSSVALMGGSRVDAPCNETTYRIDGRDCMGSICVAKLNHLLRLRGLTVLYTLSGKIFMKSTTFGNIVRGFMFQNGVYSVSGSSIAVKRIQYTVCWILLGYLTQLLQVILSKLLKMASRPNKHTLPACCQSEDFCFWFLISPP